MSDHRGSASDNNDDGSTTAALLSRFAAAVDELEETGDVEPLVALYDHASLIGNVLEPEAFQGPDGARAFWTRYRKQFEKVASTFRVIAGDGDGGVLEWETRATMAGRDVHYRGATIIELADGRIVRSCAYFDPTGLGEQLIATAP